MKKQPKYSQRAGAMNPGARYFAREYAEGRISKSRIPKPTRDSLDFSDLDKLKKRRFGTAATKPKRKAKRKRGLLARIIR